jgi:hypothetical protein
MIDRQTTTDPDRFEVRATSDSHFAWIRTRLSLEAALMAWARTAVALIGFGFAIVQFFEGFEAMERVPKALQPQAAPYLGPRYRGGHPGTADPILQYRYPPGISGDRTLPRLRVFRACGRKYIGYRDLPDADQFAFGSSSCSSCSGIGRAAH